VSLLLREGCFTMAMAKREASYSGNEQQWDVQMERSQKARHDFMQMDRPQQSLTVLLYDVSSSMEGSKHRAACEAAVAEINACDQSHFIVGAFSHDVIFPSKVPMPAAVACEAVGQLPSPEGGTALYRAVKEAAELVEQILDEHSAQYDPRLAVIKVLTDGENTVEDGNLEAARQAVARLHARGCVVSLLQAGDDPTAAEALGVPQAAALYWTDDTVGLTAACLAACEATTTYRRSMESFNSSAGTATPAISFSFTPLQRMQSTHAQMPARPVPPPLQASQSQTSPSVQPANPVPLALGRSNTFSR